MVACRSRTAPGSPAPSALLAQPELTAAGPEPESPRRRKIYTTQFCSPARKDRLSSVHVLGSVSPGPGVVESRAAGYG